MRALKAFLLGAVAAGILGYALAAVLAMASQAGGRTLDVAAGPLVLVAVKIEGTTTATTFGAGLALVALAGGIVNLAVARLLVHRSGGSGDRVD